VIVKDSSPPSSPSPSLSSLSLPAAILVPPALLAIYVFAGWLSAGREADIPAPLHFDRTIIPLHFSWEEGIPLVPWMIVPYLSLDALIVTALFLCEDREHVIRLTLQLLLATLVAAFIFVVWPMPVAFQYRYAVREHWQQTRFLYGCQALWSADRSGNRFPSLHVALAVILWPVFARRVRRFAARVAIDTWFVLVILSTLFTWQHHVADVIAGAAVGSLLWMIVSRRFFSRRNNSSAPGPNSHSAAVTPNATPVHVPR
jgi:membrane-associated phospholipid phosphatase